CSTAPLVRVTPAISAGSLLELLRTASDFGTAARGTLLIEELCDLPPALRGTLLRWIERSSESPSRCRMQPIATARRRAEGSTRCDTACAELVDRHAAATILIPPLRERTADIPHLVRHFLVLLAARLKRPLARVTDASMAALLEHPWPENVRQLC